MPPIPGPAISGSVGTVAAIERLLKEHLVMSAAEPGASPGEPGHEGIAPPPPGPAEPAAGWRPREPPLIVVDPAFVLDRWRPGDGAALRRIDLDPDTARFFGYTVEQARATRARAGEPAGMA